MGPPREAPRRPAVSSFGHLRQVARQFCPPYQLGDEARWALRISLDDPAGRRPSIAVRHRHERKLLLKANYFVAECSVPGNGPPQDGDLVFRFRGSLRRQRPSFRWRSAIADGDDWSRRLETPLMAGVRRIKAIESLRIGWTVRDRTWHLQLRTMSGSMVGGFMSPLPIAVPMDRDEAQAVVALIDALAATAS